MNRLRWIFLTAVICGAILGSCFPVRSVVVQEQTITLTDDEVDECVAGGGCVIVSRQKMWEQIEEMANLMAGSCRFKTKTTPIPS